MDNVTPQYIFNEIQAARTEYLRLTAVWEGKLQAAYTATPGSAAFVQGMKAANTMANEVSAALQRYHAAVAKMAAFYNSDRDGRSIRGDRMFK